MSPLHILLALAVVTVWGVNFVVMKIGLEVLPPVFFSFLRFACAAFPLVLFYRRPSIPWRLLWSYALAQFAIQYALLFLGLQLGMPAGLSSIVVQLQAFFTMALAVPMLHEKPRIAQLYGALVALGGMAVVAWHIEAATTLIGLVLVIGAGLSWGFGNVFTKRIALTAQAAGTPIQVMQIVAWGSLLAMPPLLAVSLLFEGPAAIGAAMTRVDWRTIGAVLFNGYVSTTFGFGAWSLLMRRYPTATVAPFPLLVPVAGMASAALLLGEPLHGWAIAAGLMVLTGLAINQFWGMRVWRRA
jgi:O-acetylserine/cysteine efflux transporter